jgi:hypothetical protein
MICPTNCSVRSRASSRRQFRTRRISSHSTSWWWARCAATYITTRSATGSLPPQLTIWISHSLCGPGTRSVALATAFPRVGDTGIRFRIADIPVDLLPFGAVEHPKGAAYPPTRSETLSVWAFSEVFAAALPLPLPTGVTVRLPTVAGYAAAKLGAWLDRSSWGETKDAADLALVVHWYAESAAVQDRL